MNDSVVCLAEVRARRGGWNRSERALLDDMAGKLRGAGLWLDTESGMTDEGEPWYVFCHGTSGDVLVHCARINEVYVVFAPLLGVSQTGPALSEVLERCLDGFVRRSAGAAATSPSRQICGS